MAAPIANTALLIRRPASEVFRAFADPDVTRRFWFTGSSGLLAPGAEVEWTWAMYGASTDVKVLAFEPDRRILISWDNRATPSEVEWTFEARGEQTFVTVENRGFSSDADGVAKAMDSLNGFSLVLAGAKIWLEHGIEPGFVLDRHPDHRVAQWRDR